MTLVKHLDVPWDWAMLYNSKTHEGRLNTGVWATLKVGDRITFYNDRVMFTVVVQDITYHSSFTSAWDMLGVKLVPRKLATTKDQVRQVYTQYYSEKDIQAHGVIALHVHILYQTIVTKVSCPIIEPSLPTQRSDTK